MAQLSFPDDSARHAIVGMTGSGKTTFGLWCLSQRSFDEMPWIIIDAKRDEHIAALPRIEEIHIERKPPTRRGLYVVRPTVADFDDGNATAFLYAVMRNGNTGLFIDEGYAFNRFDKGLRTVLTQGRSKHIPMISLSQKPSWVSPFLFSEAEYKSIFYLDMPADIERVMEWMPAGVRDPVTGGRVNPNNLPEHHSYWRCGPRREFDRLGACEPMPEILDRFDRRHIRRTFI